MLPVPLALANGHAVRDAKTWTEKRRPEILELYRSEDRPAAAPRRPPN